MANSTFPLYSSNMVEVSKKNYYFSRKKCREIKVLCRVNVDEKMMPILLRKHDSSQLNSISRPSITSTSIQKVLMGNMLCSPT